MNEFMEKAIINAKFGIENNYGGPFGSVIVDKNNNIIAEGCNHVLINNDPTAHGEIVAIRNACQKLNTYDLSGCTLYTNAYPCPMCLGAIIWANIDKVFYGATALDTGNIGFRDDMIYDFIMGKNTMLDLKEMNRDECLKVFDEYKKMNGTIY